MITAFLLGLTGSFGHCVGMCGGVTLLLSRRGLTRGWHGLLLHLGRISSYALLGALAGSLGGMMAHGMVPRGSMSGHGHATAVLPLSFTRWQGGLAMLTAVVAGYMALALLGRVPSPELLLAALTRRWGIWMRRQVAEQSQAAAVPKPLAAFGLGMAWGFLPCGLVLAGLLTAATAASTASGALVMVAFGLGTWPVLLGLWLASKSEWRLLQSATFRRYTRPVAALVVLLFAAQMALRGLAAWGWVAHLSLGELVLW